MNEEEMPTIEEIEKALNQYIKQLKKVKQSQNKRLSKEERKRIKKLETNTDEW